MLKYFKFLPLSYKILILIPILSIYPFFRNHEKEKDESEIDYKYKPDVYFVIGAVSFIILLVLCVAIYKAFVMLKISLNDGIDDTVPVENNRNNQRQNQENIQSVASGQFLNGKHSTETMVPRVVMLSSGGVRLERFSRLLSCSWHQTTNSAI